MPPTNYHHYRFMFSKATFMQVLWILGLVSLLHSLSTYRFFRQKSAQHDRQQAQYAYHIGLIGDETRVLPMSHKEQASRALMRTSPVSTRYNYTTSEATEEWLSMFPMGAGSYRFHDTDPNRVAFVAMYHELHCIQTLAHSLIQNHKKDWPHLHHCFSYMRQLIMCRPDITLEAGKFEDDQFVSQAPGSVHVCRDWRKPYSNLESNMEAWKNDSEK